MSSPDSRLARFVDAVLRDRRPPRFPADPEDEAAMRAAALLRAAHPGADLPTQEFVDSLHERLAGTMGEGRPTPGHIGRRAFIRGASIAAAAAAVGVAGDRLLLGGEQKPALPPNAELRPHGGQWHAVAEVSALVPGRAVRFSAGGIEGFVVRNGSAILALSAVCTHQGCLLAYRRDTSDYVCPCHGATFAVDGTPADPSYTPPMTRLVHRVQDARVEVLVGADV